VTSKLPADLARSRLVKRAKQQVALTSGITPKALHKTPSQRRSESGRKKLLKKAGISTEVQVPGDCFNCPKEPCGKAVDTCEERVARSTGPKKAGIR
jgi:hypothetical protein